MQIEILGRREIEAMRIAGRIAAATLDTVGAQLHAGMSTGDIHTLVAADTWARGAAPSQLGYHGFPAAVCTSRNEVVCHGIPSADEILHEGDIVNVDVTSHIGGFHGDTSRTFDLLPEFRSGQNVRASACGTAGEADEEEQVHRRADGSHPS